MCQEFINVIAEREREKIVAKIEMAKFLSLMSDGSQCVASTENTIVYLRLAIKGEIYVYLIRLVPVSKADVDGIYRSLMYALESLPISSNIADIKANIICFGLMVHLV